MSEGRFILSLLPRKKNTHLNTHMNHKENTEKHHSQRNPFAFAKSEFSLAKATTQKDKVEFTTSLQSTFPRISFSKANIQRSLTFFPATSSTPCIHLVIHYSAAFIHPSNIRQMSVEPLLLYYKVED